MKKKILHNSALTLLHTLEDRGLGPKDHYNLVVDFAILIKNLLNIGDYYVTMQQREQVKE